MPYILIGIALVVFLSGVARLRAPGRYESRQIPWRSLLIWVVLFGAGALVWAWALPVRHG